jgi:hypothetical protein
MFGAALRPPSAYLHPPGFLPQAQQVLSPSTCCPFFSFFSFASDQTYQVMVAGFWRPILIN